MNTYWIRRWIDDLGITTSQQVEQLLGENRHLQQLVSYASEQSEAGPVPRPDKDRVLVGGLGLDLSGQFECMQHHCATKAVDRLVHQTWHSFDTVVVSGLDSQLFMNSLKRKGTLVGLTNIDILRLRPHIEAALYVKQTGADELIEFADRPKAFCRHHYDEAIQLSGLSNNIEAAHDSLITHFLTGYRLTNASAEERTVFVYNHPTLETVLVRRFQSETSEDEAAWAIAEDLAHEITNTSITSSVLARNMSAGLGQVMRGMEADFAHLSNRRVTDEVAFHIPIPMVENLPLEDLMKIRREEQSEFQAFQVALRMAIEERLKALPGADPLTIGESVYDDILNPALISMERRLQKSTEVFAKRSAVAIVVGTVMTTVGLLALAPVVAPGIAIGVGGLVANYHELLKDKRDVQISDLHFLWTLSSRMSPHR